MVSELGALDLGLTTLS